MAEKSRILILHLMRSKEVVRGHFSTTAQHARTLGLIGSGGSRSILGTSLELEEVIDLLSVLLVLIRGGSSIILRELSVSYFAITRYWSVGTHTLLAHSNHSDAIVHFTG